MSCGDPNDELMARVAGIARAAFEDIGLANEALLMSVNDNSGQGRLTPWAAWPVCVAGMAVIIHSTLTG